jgi:hypothetical protein
MAKKVVATLAKSAVKQHVKVIRMVKYPKTGMYRFKEDIISSDSLDEFLSKPTS